MDYRDLTEQDYSSVFDAFKSAVEGGYGLKVQMKELDSSITGDFDGVQIFIRSDLPEEMKLFILGHLFGHTIQFNTSEESRKIGLTYFGPHNITPEMLEKIQQYENDASRYAMQLFHNLKRGDLDQWLSDWVAADWKYLKELYTSGRKSDFSASFIANFKPTYFTYGGELLTPLSIPTFKPQKWESRFSF
jgi:hypothetical protein